MKPSKTFMQKLKIFYSILLSVLIFLTTVSCTNQTVSPAALSSSTEATSSSPTSNEILFDIPQLGSGDAKFYKDKIITSVNSKLNIFDLSGEVLKVYEEVNCNWIDALPEENIILYANWNNQVGLLQLSDDFEILTNTIIMETDYLQIDPSIIKVSEKYYITLTEIEGTVNNADPNAENGFYTLHFFESENLIEWTFLTNIIQKNNNIEDIDLLFFDNHFIVIYEEEIIDKGDSSIHAIISDDSTGTHFTQIHTLLSSTCDHEPSSLQILDNGTYRLYYSCDKDNRGSSYMGSKAYYADYDKDWTPIVIDIEINTFVNTGVLLYDVLIEDEGIILLYAKDYLSTNDLIAEKIV